MRRSRSAYGIPLATVVFWISAAGQGSADDVFLAGGGRVAGVVIGETAQSVVIETGPGRVTIPASRVIRIERNRSALSEFRSRAGQLAQDDVRGWLALGAWAREHELDTQAHAAFQKALALEPGNPDANLALGRVNVEGRWMSSDDGYRARGYVRYEGGWITPAEREAIVRARADEAAAAAARHEAEARVREAEARARQAEAEARMAEASTYPPDGSGAIPLWWGFGGTRFFPFGRAHLRSAFLPFGFPFHHSMPSPVPVPPTPPPRPTPTPVH